MPPLTPSDGAPQDAPVAAATLAGPSPTRRRLVGSFAAAVACALAILALDLATPVRAQGSDTTPGRLGAVVFACTGSVDLREVDWIRRASERGALPYFAQRARDGSVQSTFGPMPAVLGSLGMRSLQPGMTLRDRALMRRARYGAAIALTSAALFLFLAVSARASARRAAAGALVAALSFAGVATVGQGLWQLTAALPPMMAALACVAWAPRSRLALACAPALLVIATMIRPTSFGATLGIGIAWIVAMGAARAGRARSGVAAAALVLAALAAAPFVVSSLRLWGSLVPANQYRAALAVPGDQAAFSLAPGRFVPSLAALVASPGRGLLVFAPIALLALATVVAVARSRTARGMRGLLRSEDAATLAVVSGVIAQLVIAAAYRFWWGGTCFGPRFVAETVWLGAFVVWADARPQLGPWFGRAALAASAWTIAVGVLGLFRYDAQLWDMRREVNARAAHVVWDPIDSPLAAMLTRARPAQELIDGQPGPFLYCRGGALVDLAPETHTIAAPHTGL